MSAVTLIGRQLCRGRRPFLVAAVVFVLLGNTACNARTPTPKYDQLKLPLPGQIVVDRANPAWLKYEGGGPHFLAGLGDPEDFLYRGSQNPDGTRDGDQMALIDKLKGTGANGIYFQAVRSHGGDGEATHNPFIDNDPDKGLNIAVLDQWEVWFSQLESAGVVIYFFFYDDSARIWPRGISRIWKDADSVDANERSFIESLVDRFQHHANLVWVVAEEYQEAFSATHVSHIAAIIRNSDDYDHVIGVHKLSGLSFDEFADNPNIDQFMIQYNKQLPSELHGGMVKAWRNAAGRYNLNLSEVAGHGGGAVGRRKNWASAMGGAYVMVLGMDIRSAPISDLEDLGRLHNFMESTDFFEMAPHDELALSGTDYVLAAPGHTYIAYSEDLIDGDVLGIKDLTAGRYRLKWFDPITGNTDYRSINLGDGDHTLTSPEGFDGEVALYIQRIDSDRQPTFRASAIFERTNANTKIEITLRHSGTDAPGYFEYIIVTPPQSGSLSGTGDKRIYMPHVGFSGIEKFEYIVSDGNYTSPPATVTIEVDDSSINLAPVVRNTTIHAYTDTKVILSLTFEDSDGPGPYTFSIVDYPKHGRLSGTGNDLAYLPDNGFLGQDRFTWRVSNSANVSNLATVNIIIEEKPPD